MGINWESGEINSTPYRLRSEQVHPTLQEMEPPYFGYIDEDSLRAGPENILWIDPASLVIEGFRDMDGDWLRIIKVNEGYILDASRCGISREEGTAIIPSHDIDFENQGWVQVIAVLETDEERNELEKLIFEKYENIMDFFFSDQLSLDIDSEQ